MPIDSRDKRASAISVTLPWRGMLPVPDGTLVQGDRQQVALMYRGILASAAIANPYPPRRWRTGSLARGHRKRHRRC